MVLEASMPPRHPPHHRGRRGHVPRSAVSSFVDLDRIDDILARIVDSGEDRAFLIRCMLDEGPAHHRGANYTLVALLGELLRRLGSNRRAQLPGRAVPVPMRLPPHLEDQVEDGDYPLQLPVAPLEALSTTARDVEAMVDCLIDGPPQHAVANVVMVALLQLALEAAGSSEP